MAPSSKTSDLSDVTVLPEACILASARGASFGTDIGFETPDTVLGVTSDLEVEISEVELACPALGAMWVRLTVEASIATVISRNDMGCEPLPLVTIRRPERDAACIPLSLG